MIILIHVNLEDFKNWLIWQRSRTKLHIIPIIITLLFTVMMIMIRIIMILLICMFFRIELNIQNSVISWRIPQMAGIGRQFFMIFWTILFITYSKNQFHLERHQKNDSAKPFSREENPVILMLMKKYMSSKNLIVEKFAPTYSFYCAVVSKK